MGDKDKSELPIIQHTPIEQWIEESRNKCYPKQKGITNTESNKKMGKKVAFTRGCKELLTYLGLSGIENPREWVESMKIHKDITGFQTPAELTAYEKGRNDEEKVMVKFIGDWQPNETNSVIGQLLADKNNKLQAELKQAKADAWDEGRDSTFRSDTPNPENPYKEEPNHN